MHNTAVGQTQTLLRMNIYIFVLTERCVCVLVVFSLVIAPRQSLVRMLSKK